MRKSTRKSRRKYPKDRRKYDWAKLNRKGASVKVRDCKRPISVGNAARQHAARRGFKVTTVRMGKTITVTRTTA